MLSDQEMLQFSQRIADQSFGVKERVGRYLTTHSEQHRYEAVKQILSIITWGNCIIEQINRYEFSVQETEHVKAFNVAEINTEKLKRQ